MKKIISILLVLILLIKGSSQKEFNDDFIKLEPSKLFQGDTIGLEPDMDMITGCVDVNYMTPSKKSTTRQKISNILFIIVGFIWIYRGVVNFHFKPKWNILGILIAVVLISLNLSLLKDNCSK